MSGRVEVLNNDTWGTVCDEDWDIIDAHVVCKQLGFASARIATGGEYYGRGSGPMWMKGVNCRGDEQYLSQCPQGNYRYYYCETAGVECTGEYC